MALPPYASYRFCTLYRSYGSYARDTEIEHEDEDENDWVTP
jgi:hypothetical protein